MICKINSTTEKLNSSNSNIFFTAYTAVPDILIELVYMIETCLVVSIFVSIFLEMFANVEFPNSFWSKLGLDALGLKPNGNYRIVASTNTCYYSENQVFGGVTIRVLCSKRGCY